MADGDPQSGLRSRRTVVAACVCVALIGAGLILALRPTTARETAAIRVELRSWVVFGQGRHLYALVYPPTHPRSLAAAAPRSQAPARDVPPTADELVGVARVEYWKTDLRDGYTPPADAARAERIAKVQAGVVVRPLLAAPDNRLEAVYLVTPEQALELTRDRVFAERYFLLGPNSTSGLRAAFRAAGLEFPARVLAGRGALGEFPGVDLPAGAEIAPGRWAEFGLPRGPEEAPVFLRASGADVAEAR